MKSLKESLFDSDLVQKKPPINGVNVDPEIWDECVRFWKKEMTTSRVIKKNTEDLKVLYFDKNDCLIAVYEEDGANSISDRWLYVLCPETIYMNYLCEKHNHPDDIDIDFLYEYIIISGYYSLAFVKKVGYEKYWLSLEGCGGIPSRKEGIGANEITNGYIPWTISSKAKKIIEDYK